jgi:hypothetical protein
MPPATRLTAGRAPSTLGTFLRAFTFGHVRQLDAVAARLLVNLAEQSPLLVGADQVAFLDIDDTIKATYGHKKQGAGYGYSGVKGLNVLLATCSTPVSAPVIAATRLRRGGELRQGRGPPGRRRPGHRGQGQRHRTGHCSLRLGFMSNST